jgi:hypothetical protein
VLDMSMSLDGYIADPNDFLGGEDGERLHKWADADGESGQPSGPTGQFQDDGTRPVLSSQDGGPPSSWIIGAVITTVSRSSCPATGRPARPPAEAIRW